MTTITCETATLVDAIQRAARVAPSKGAAFDKAAGVLFEINPDKPSPLYIKASNLESTYMQRVATLKVEGDAAIWRLPSALLSGIMGTLPTDQGRQVVMTDDGNEVKIETGATNAVLRSMDPSVFPAIKPFHPVGMVDVDALPRRLDQVAWACDNDTKTALGGVYIDGTMLSGCDSYLLAQMPCVVPVDEPIIVPMAAVSYLLRNTGSVKMRATDDRLHLMPDDDTQITCTILPFSYPNVAGIKRTDFSCEFKAMREPLLEIVGRILVLGKSERYIHLKLSAQKDRLVFSMQVPQVGQVDDVLDVQGGPTDGAESFDFIMDPARLNSLAMNSTAAELTFRCGPRQTHAINVSDVTGYEVWCQPIGKSAAPGAAGKAA